VALTLSPFAEDLITTGAITAGSTALAMGVSLVIGALARLKGKSIDPWRVAAEQGAPLGAVFGIVIALIELVPWG
jgi:hypothetical protein